MKKKIMGLVLAAMMTVSALAGCGGSTYQAELPTASEEAEIFVAPVEGLSDDFIKGMDISRGALEAITHDNTYKHRSIGKTMMRIEKYEVDVLGNVRKVGTEKRQSFDKRKK